MLTCLRALLASSRCCRASRGLPANAAVAVYVCLSGKAGRNGGTCGGGSCAGSIDLCITVSCWVGSIQLLPEVLYIVQMIKTCSNTPGWHPRYQRQTRVQDRLS